MTVICSMVQLPPNDVELLVILLFEIAPLARFTWRVLTSVLNDQANGHRLEGSPRIPPASSPSLRSPSDYLIINLSINHGSWLPWPCAMSLEPTTINNRLINQAIYRLINFHVKWDEKLLGQAPTANFPNSVFPFFYPRNTILIAQLQMFSDYPRLLIEDWQSDRSKTDQKVVDD